MDPLSLRRASAKIFGNEKTAEVVRGLRDESCSATAQQLAKRTAIDHSLVRDVLVRLADAGVLRMLPRASSRAPQYYEANPRDPVWTALAALADALAEAHTPGGVLQPDQSSEPG